MSPAPRDWAFLPRDVDLQRLFAGVRSMDCVSVVGISNLGKSALLRSLTSPAVQASHLGAEAGDYLFIYIDFNQMLDVSEQAFYELFLRCAIDALQRRDREDGALRRIEQCYTGVTAPNSPFEVPLRFAQAMSAIGEQIPERVVFLLDELDGPVGGIDGRVFLNLRALKDRHRSQLTYITATNRRVSHIRADPDVQEFAELFAHHTLFISMLGADESAAFVADFARTEGVTFDDEDLAFIRSWAGGHPGLTESTCRILGMITGRPVRDPSQNFIIHRRAAEVLAQDLNIQAECRKIWGDLSDAEHDALVSVFQDSERVEVPELEAVVKKHLVLDVGGQKRIFARAFEEFVQRQQAARRPAQQGLHVDPDSGEVWVDGLQAPALTNLEYRLLLLLYGRLGKICTKYEVVEAVWGEDYIDEVDDARIEKLISRLRQKIEPDVTNLRYLLTVRGRGYKLVAG